MQYVSYAFPDGPEFESKAIVGFAIGSDSGTDDRDIFSVDDLVLAVNGSSGFSGLVDPKVLLDSVLPDDSNQSGDNGGQGAMPSEDAPGPFWVDGEDRLILTNIGATSSFQPNLQIIAADLETLELYDREMLQLVKGTKGHIALDFEDTTPDDPASVAISADIIAEMGRSISSGASAALIEASASSAASVSLIGSSGDWKKESLFGSDYEQMAKRLDPDNTYTLYVNENDGKEVGILVDSNVPVTLNVKANPALSMEASFFGYFGDFLERGEEFNAGDASGGVIDASQSQDAALIQGDDTANTMYGGQGNDTMFGLGGDDVLSGGAGADYIDGGLETTQSMAVRILTHPTIKGIYASSVGDR